MIPLILLIVLGMTVIIFLLKIFRIKSESELEDLTTTSYKDDQHIEAEGERHYSLFHILAIVICVKLKCKQF